MKMFECQHVDLWYGQLVTHLLHHGELKSDRTGKGTRSLSGGSVNLDLQKQFPAVTLKKTNLPWAFDEMSFFLKGECSNIRWLTDRKVPIWNEWADAEGNIGPVYGVEWRNKLDTKIISFFDWTNNRQLYLDQGYIRVGEFEGEGQRINNDQFLGVLDYVVLQRKIDQVENLLTDLREDPWSRRMIVEGWNAALLPDRGFKPCEQAARGKQALPPCHKSWQVIMSGPQDPTLNLVVYIRSSDIFLGLPFNIAQYAFLAHSLARYVGAKVGKLTVHFGDIHLYQHHVEQAEEVIVRHEQMRSRLELPNPQLRWVNETTCIPWDVDARTDLTIDNYVPQGFIKAEPAV